MLQIIRDSLRELDDAKQTDQDSDQDTDQDEIAIKKLLAALPFPIVAPVIFIYNKEKHEWKKRS